MCIVRTLHYITVILLNFYIALIAYSAYSARNSDAHFLLFKQETFVPSSGDSRCIQLIQEKSTQETGGALFNESISQLSRYDLLRENSALDLNKLHAVISGAVNDLWPFGDGNNTEFCPSSAQTISRNQRFMTRVLFNVALFTAISFFCSWTLIFACGVQLLFLVSSFHKCLRNTEHAPWYCVDIFVLGLNFTSLFYFLIRDWIIGHKPTFILRWRNNPSNPSPSPSPQSADAPTQAPTQAPKPPQIPQYSQQSCHHCRPQPQRPLTPVCNPRSCNIFAQSEQLPLYSKTAPVINFNNFPSKRADGCRKRKSKSHGKKHQKKIRTSEKNSKNRTLQRTENGPQVDDPEPQVAPMPQCHCSD